MKTFTLNELRTNYGLLKTTNVVELSSGAFTLESRQRGESTTFPTRAEAETVLQAEVVLRGDGLADAKVIELHPSNRFAVEGYMVSRLEEEFATREEADTVLNEAAKSLAEAYFHEMSNKSALPVVEVINTGGGHITVREGATIGRWYTFTDANGEEQGSANSLSLLSCFVGVTSGVPPVNTTTRTCSSPITERCLSTSS